MKIDAHGAKNVAAHLKHLFIQLERRDTEGQQTADLRMTVKNVNVHARAHENIGAAQTGRPGADHRHPLRSRGHFADCRPPAHRQRGIGDIALKVANGDRAAFVLERAGPFAQPVLWTDPAANLRQGADRKSVV